MKQLLLSSRSGLDTKRVFVVTRWCAVVTHAIEAGDMFAYRNEKQRPEQLVYSQVLEQEDKRSLAELIYEYKAIGRVQPTGVSRDEQA